MRWRGAPRFPRRRPIRCGDSRSEEHTSELQSRGHLVCCLLLEKKYQIFIFISTSIMNILIIIFSLTVCSSLLFIIFIYCFTDVTYTFSLHDALPISTVKALSLMSADVEVSATATAVCRNAVERSAPLPAAATNPMWRFKIGRAHV